MKKVLFTSLVLFTLLVMTTGTVFAGSVISLIGVRDDDGVPKFTFQVSGEFSRSELNSGFVQVENGKNYPLYCSQQDATTVVCHTSKAAIGKNLVVDFGGQDFWTFVKETNYVAPGPVLYCSPVYDYAVINTARARDTGWVVWTEHCQDTQPVEYDDILLDGAPSNGGVIFTYLAPGVDWMNWYGPIMTIGYGWYQ